LAATTPFVSTRNNRTILFVHIGKAGGETIKSVLETGCQVMRNAARRNKCLAGLQNSRLSDSVKGYFHCFKIQPPQMAHKADSYLFNVRHPVDRAISWYHYINPFNCVSENNRISPNCAAANQLQNKPGGFVSQFFDLCFRTVEDWVYGAIGKRANGEPALQACVDLAHKSLAGKLDWKDIPLAAHMTANYQQYTSMTTRKFKSKEILVVRMEHMWDDLKSLDVWLGGTGDFGRASGTKYSHGSETYGGSKSITVATAKLFCCALQSEMEIYLDLITSAANLLEVHKQQTRDAATARCGFASWDEMISHCATLAFVSR